jgi:DNA modification methylase
MTPERLAEYQAFIEAKVALAQATGFEVSSADVNPACKPHVRQIVPWAIRKGCAGIFSLFGLQKTSTQLELVRLMLQRVGGRALIVCPLNVRQEFRRDALQLLGWSEAPRFVRTSAEVTEDAGIYLTNWESVREGKIHPELFNVATFDEADALRSFGSKTFGEVVIGEWRNIPHRFVASATPDPNNYLELLGYAQFLGAMDIGQAKAQPLDARILTPSGWKTMGEVRVGDQVIAGDGTATRVLGVYPQGDRPIYRVTFSDGGWTECDAEHLWLTFTKGERERRTQVRPRSKAKSGRVRSTAEIAATLTDSSGSRYSIPLVDPVEFSERPLLIDPWLLGVLIGDGSLQEGSVGLASADAQIVERIRAELPRGLLLKLQGRYNYRICGESRRLTGRGKHPNEILNHLRTYELIGCRAWEKRVPAVYLLNTSAVRLEILRGLMDSDGHAPRVKRDSPRFVTTSEGLAQDVQFLVRSLGGESRITRRRAPGRPAYTVSVRMPAGRNPFWLPRKADLWRSSDRLARFIVAVEPAGTKPAQCIAIEHSSRLYVTDDFAVTHNTRFFKRDSEHADKLSLHQHKEAEFWLWVASWAIVIQKPSDICGHRDGCACDAGYELPELDIRWHEIASDHSDAGAEKSGQLRLTKNVALGVTHAAREKRDSLPARMAKLLELRAEEPDAHRLIWHDLEIERKAIEAALPDVVTVYGTQGLEEREEAVRAFGDGETPELASKPVLLAAGCNLQRHCSWEIFLGITYKFRDLIQAIHRVHRFGQARRVRIDFIYTEAERAVRYELEAKWARYNAQTAHLAKLIRELGLAEVATAAALTRSIGVERREAAGERYRFVLNDTVLEAAAMEDDSVDLIVTSPPFSTQYEYTPSYNDFGHTDSADHFWQQLDFLTPELLRVLRPGRIAAVHVKDRVVDSGMTGLGFQVVHPFHAEAIAHFQRHGFAFLGMKTIVTDVVRENAQTYRLGWTEQCKDGTRMGAGLPEYLLIFRKPQTDRSRGYADEPVVKDKPLVLDAGGVPREFAPKDRRPIIPGTGYSRGRWQMDAHGFARSSGERLLTPSEIAALPWDAVFNLFRDHSRSTVYDYERDVALAEALEREGRLPPDFMLLQPASWHPEVWTDVTRMRSLNGNQAARNREKHLCPLPFDIVNRAIEQYSEPGEVVWDCFGGIGTVPYCAVLRGRVGWATELNPRYWADGAGYCAAAEREITAPSLFDLMEPGA